MPFEDSGFFGIDKMFDDDKGCFFTDVDVNTLTGKNQVLNYLARMDLELRAVGYTEAVVEIAGFYDDFCTKGGNKIADFYLNPVAQMILEKIEEMPRLKAFLYERVFDEIKEQYIKECEQTYLQNENLENKVQEQEQNFKKDKVLQNREIKKLAKENNISFDEAKKLYEQNKQDEIEKEHLMNFLNRLPKSFALPMDSLNNKTCIDVTNLINPKKSKHRQNKKNNDKTKYISLDDDIKNNDNNNDDTDDLNNFWNL